MYELSKIKKKNICIMGLMGSGKSIIGKDDFSDESLESSDGTDFEEVKSPQIAKTKSKSKNTFNLYFFSACIKVDYLIVDEFRIYNKYELHSIFKSR